MFDAVAYTRLVTDGTTRAKTANRGNFFQAPDLIPGIAQKRLRRSFEN